MSPMNDLMPPSCNDGPEWRVTECPCGRLTLRLGQTRVEFSREEFAALYRLVQHAMVEFEVAESRRPVYHVRAKTAH